MLERAGAVVIGSGALGASTAFHLVRMGCSPVVLVDQHAIASQTSPRAAGLTAQVRRSALMTDLAIQAVHKIERFAEETGQPLAYHQSGSLKIARRPEHVAQLEEEVELGQQRGVAIELISPARAAELMPFLRPQGIRAVSYSHHDLYLEPVQIPLGYARAAEVLGAVLLPDTTVTGIVVDGGRVSRVVTDRGEIATPVVVDAAGGWARVVAAQAQAAVPMVPTRHQLLITQPIEGVKNGQPITRIIDANVYVRPADGGLMLGGYETDPLQYREAHLPRGVDDMPLDMGVLRRLADLVAEQLPVFAGDIRVRVHRGGLPTMTSDGEHIMGPVRAAEGLYVIGGCCVGGLSIAPILGELLAEWILVGKPRVDLSSLLPDRFGSEMADEARLRRWCLWQYAHHYWAEPSRPEADHPTRQ